MLIWCANAGHFRLGDEIMWPLLYVPDRHFGGHSRRTTLVALLQQANGDEGAGDGQQAAAGTIQGYWQDDGEEEDLHMEDSM